MKALITGIAGFAGSHLADLLVKKGYDVYGTVLEGESLWRIEGIRDRIKLYECNIVDEERISQVVREVSPDRLYHLAAQSSMGKSFDNPKLTFEVNVLGTVNLLEALRKYGKKAELRALLVSSVEIYGIVEEKHLPVTEEQPLRPVNPYGASKAAMDLIGYQYFRCYDLSIIRVRPSNHIGPRQELGFFVPDFASKIVEVERGIKKEIQVGTLTVSRDLTDVRDVVRGYWIALEKGKAGEAYNICSGIVHSVEEILAKLVEQARVPIKVRSSKEERRATDIPILKWNYEKLKRDVGWEPEIDIEQTLRQIMEQFRVRPQR